LIVDDPLINNFHSVTSSHITFASKITKAAKLAVLDDNNSSLLAVDISSTETHPGQNK